MKVAAWPSRTVPTSASSTATWSVIAVRSRARVKRTGVCSGAATVWPASTWRDSTMPSIGERISVRWTSVRACVTDACDTVVWARAEATSASARRALARAVSRSWSAISPASCMRSVRRRICAASSADACAPRQAGARRVELRRRLREARLGVLGIDGGEHLPLLDAVVEVGADERMRPDTSLPTSTVSSASRVPVA